MVTLFSCFPSFAIAAACSGATNLMGAQDVCKAEYAQCISNHPAAESTCANNAVTIGRAMADYNQCVLAGTPNCDSKVDFAEPLKDFNRKPDPTYKVSTGPTSNLSGCFTNDEHPTEVSRLANNQCPPNSVLLVNGSQAQQVDVKMTYKPLEPIPGLENLTGNLEFNQLLAGIFRILILFGGIIAVGAFVYAGVVYMVSEAIGTKVYAKQRIKAAFLGLLLLVGCWLILQTINPQLLIFNNGLNPVQKTVFDTTPEVKQTQIQQDAKTCESSNGSYTFYGNGTGGFLGCSAANRAGKIPAGSGCVSDQFYSSGGVCSYSGAALQKIKDDKTIQDSKNLLEGLI